LVAKLEAASKTLSSEGEILSQQRDIWNRFSTGWRKWDALNMRLLKPAADAMLTEIPWRRGISILDVACGTGEPGLTAASIAREGHVLAIDLADHMVQAARDSARIRGLKNFRAETASVDRIPAGDGTFDAILCRYGFMFFPNVADALAEFRRVLKPDGRVIVAVWSSPAKNTWATTVMNVIRAHVDLPPTPADAPGLFRFGQIEGLAEAFWRAGLRELQFQELEWVASYESPDRYWEYMTEVPAGVAQALAGLRPDVKAQIRTQVLKAVSRYEPNQEVHLTCGTHVVSALS
jgi:ubiquinone/menaquinone biosynthesis C-methylase UbiE